MPKRTASYNLLRDKAFIKAKNPKYDGYQIDLASMVYKCFDKNFASFAWSETLTRDKSASGGDIKNEIMPNQISRRMNKNHLKENLEKEKYSHLL